MKVLSVLLCSIVFVAAVPQPRRFLIPEQRSDITLTGQSSQAIPYEYQIVPSSEYDVAPYQEDYSVLDYVLNPDTAIASIGSAALSLVKWVIVNASLVLLGMSIVIGLCGFSSYCDITIENPFTGGISIPYLDDVHYYFNEAYHKYHDLQSWK